MELLQRKGFSYSFDPAACRQCSGACCRGKSGNIWVKVGEAEQIATYLQVSPIDIIGLYLVRVDNRISIRERYVDGKYECVFFDAQELRCSIYAVRPEQCRSFPFWSYFRGREDELLHECPGVRLNG
jgi:Fe-S-cluster containining protein